jgi:hypothetical protein
LPRSEPWNAATRSSRSRSNRSAARDRDRPPRPALS